MKTISFKGKTACNTGSFYAPYVPLMGLPHHKFGIVHHSSSTFSPIPSTEEIKITSAGWYATVPHDYALEVHDWCKKNFQGKWTFEAGVTRLLYIENERDAVLFTLRWI